MQEIMIKVDGVDMPCPSAFAWGIQDVSAAESGRTDDAVMHKNRKAQKRKLTLQWVGKNWQETSKIIKAFNPEYINIRYPDMLSGQYETRKFYCGDRTAPVKFWRNDKKLIDTISFDVIEV